MRTRTQLAAGMLGGMCLLVPVIPASAALITQSNSVALTNTAWDDTLIFNLFDPSLGTLNSITFSLTGTVDGMISVENRGQGAMTLTSTHSATITLTRPDLSTIVVAPSASLSANLTAYDGVIDFAGTSGITQNSLMASSTQSVMSPPPVSDLASFTGLGTISLPISATAWSTTAGGGNMLTMISTQAGAQLDLTYDYTPTTTNVPEPGTLTLFGSGLIALGAFTRRRKAKAKK